MHKSTSHANMGVVCKRDLGNAFPDALSRFKYTFHFMLAAGVFNFTPSWGGRCMDASTTSLFPWLLSAWEEEATALPQLPLEALF